MGKKEYKSAKTGKTYKIRRHYTCENHTHLVYLVRCVICNINYIGQTTQNMKQRHIGHRSEIRRGYDAVGRHFKQHGESLDLKNDKIFEEHVMNL